MVLSVYIRKKNFELMNQASNSRSRKKMAEYTPGKVKGRKLFKN